MLSTATKTTLALQHELGNVSRQARDFQQARHYLEQSLETRDALLDDKDNPGIADTLHELGNVS